MARGRRGAGEGSIYQRKSDGLWVGSLVVGYDANGRRRRRVQYGATRREVAEKLSELQSDARSGPIPKPERLTVGAFLDRWLEDSARTRVRSTT